MPTSEMKRMKYIALIIATAIFLIGCAKSSIVIAQGNFNSNQTSGKIYSENEVSEKAVILKRPNPVYPQELMNSTTCRGRLAVKLKVVLLKSGEVGDVAVIKRQGCKTTESAINAVRLIKFNPALKIGIPVSQYIFTTCYFAKLNF
jgi:hypothetical protein